MTISVSEMHKETLLENIDKIHTTEMGVGRIQRNLGIDDEPVSYCISKLKKENSKVKKEGKNYYVEIDGCIKIGRASCRERV